VSVLFSVAAGLLAAAAGVVLGALMLDVFLAVLQRAVGPAEAETRSVAYPKGEWKRTAVATKVNHVFSNSISLHHFRSNRGIDRTTGLDLNSD